MARPLRIEYEEYERAVYHVTSRDNMEQLPGDSGTEEAAPMLNSRLGKEKLAGTKEI